MGLAPEIKHDDDDDDDDDALRDQDQNHGTFILPDIGL